MSRRLAYSLIVFSFVSIVLSLQGCSSNPSHSESNCTPGECSTLSEKTTLDASGVRDKEPPKGCQPGTTQCRCTPTGMCLDDLRCIEGVCQVCTKGKPDCGCKKDGSCDRGLHCVDGRCQGCVGVDTCPCYGNGNCSTGHICKSTRAGILLCSKCGSNTLDCNCTSDADCGKLACINKRCQDLSKVNQIPHNPKCYSPCQSDLQQPDGSIRTCHPEYKLAEGCGADKICKEGSCQGTTNPQKLTVDQYPFCKEHADCPEWQTCIMGRCYSTCSSAAHCPSGFKCHMYVCRRRCNVQHKVCQKGEFCETKGSDNGICMPTSSRKRKTAQVKTNKGTYSVPFHSFQFTNTSTRQTLQIINKSTFSTFFKIHRSRDTISSKSPLQWLTFEQCKQYDTQRTSCITWDSPSTQEPFVVRDVLPSQKVLIRIRNAAGKPKQFSRYQGTLVISNETMGTQSVDVVYRESANGHWHGTMLAFGNFDDRDVHLFPYDPSQTKAQTIRNALLQNWVNFLKQRISFMQFRAILDSIKERSWKQEKVQKDCIRLFSQTHSQDIRCYPYSSPKGYEILTSSNRESPVPSGNMELRFAINIQETSKHQMKGRIVSEKAFQYPGNPAIQLSFKSKPGARAITLLRSMQAVIDVGGRFHIQTHETCGSSGTFEKWTYPWMIPGFTVGSTARKGELYRERSECRSKVIPNTQTGKTDQERRAIAEYNKALSASNPIPNGWRLRRQIQLLDGALIQNRYLFILYKESFARYTPVPSSSGTQRDFTHYGYILLERTPADLSKKDYVGSSPPTFPLCPKCPKGSSCQGLYCRPSNKIKQVMCDPALVQKAIRKNIQSTHDLHKWDVSSLQALTYTLIHGQSTSVRDDSRYHITRSARGYGYIHPQTQKQHFIHYFCEDTQQLDGGPSTQPNDCPVGSRVIYFDLPEIDDTQLRKEPCNTTQTCFKRLQQLKQLQHFRENVPYRCQHKNEVLCDTHRQDPRKGKIFFKPPHKSAYIAPFQPIQDALYEAFRYRLKFVSRSGKNIGFTPEICDRSTRSQIPYCYAPTQIEELEQRVNCLEYIVSTSALRTRLQTQQKETYTLLVHTLKHIFSYSSTRKGEHLRTHFGFEYLNAELRVMLGDEAFTRSLDSRYNLAQSNLLSFDGGRFEPNGVQLSGAIGYELHNLYLSVQYYQTVLHRFFKQTHIFQEQLSTTQTHRFITAETATSYLKKILLSSMRKARSMSQIARRYHQLNRSDIAQRIIKRAYASTYMEMTIITHLLRMLIRSTDPKQGPQLRAEMDSITLTYKSSLLGMEETYKKLQSALNAFGLPEGYIPFPSVDLTSATTQNSNAFTVAMQYAQKKLYIAKEKEQIALQSKRSFDTHAASFQNELARIEQSYDRQLLDICGGIEVKSTTGSTQIHPAIPRYAALSPKTRRIGNPCGLVPGGQLYNAMGEFEKARLGLQSLQQQVRNLQTQIKNEKERIQKYCESKFLLANIHWKYKGKTNNLQLELESLQRTTERTQRIANTASQVAELQKCSIIIGTASGGDCPQAAVAIGATIKIAAVQEASIRVLELLTKDKREEQLALERKLEKTQIQFECRGCDISKPSCNGSKKGIAHIESNIRIKEMSNSILSLHYEMLKAQYNIQMATSNVIRLQQQARRLMTLQEEAIQMALNVQAAQNDPNVRIYKNDAFLSAERTFRLAIREAYRTTLVYEYYTGTSYAHKGDLYLMRMISHGDKNVEMYLNQLEQAFREFEEEHGKPDIRVLVLSLRDDILRISRMDAQQKERSLTHRIAEFQKALTDRNRINEEGWLYFPFEISVIQSHSAISPITLNHKVLYIEAQIIGGEVGDEIGRVYLRQKGTGVVRVKADAYRYYSLPQRTAVINTYFNGSKLLSPEIYKNYRLRDRPLGNTQWILIFNQASEKSNQDIQLNSINDIRLYMYYTDFTRE